jgi:hypothetical protein
MNADRAVRVDAVRCRASRPYHRVSRHNAGARQMPQNAVAPVIMLWMYSEIAAEPANPLACATAEGGKGATKRPLTGRFRNELPGVSRQNPMRSVKSETRSGLEAAGGVQRITASSSRIAPGCPQRAWSSSAGTFQFLPRDNLRPYLE